MEDNEVKVEKDGIVHVLHVDKDGEPIKDYKPQKEKKNIKWKKTALIYIIVFIFTALMLAIIATVTNTKVTNPGYLNTAIQTYFIYRISEKKDWKLWKKILLIIVSYIGVELGMWLVVKIVLFLFGLVIMIFHL